MSPTTSSTTGNTAPDDGARLGRGRELGNLDLLLGTFEQGLRTVWGVHRAARPCPKPAADVIDAGDMPGAGAAELNDGERALAGALMRVNHVGEVCAQALYHAQALATRDPALRDHFMVAAEEETDHLAWTEQRMKELGSRPSLLNPLWYAGAFGIGLVAGKLGGDRTSLGFVIETERQVEQHLDGHLSRLPPGDAASRAIVTQMRDDEVRHAVNAENAGGVRPPAPIRGLMRLAAKVMTTAAHRI
ncbi:MAG: 2-polyprenyl-3-methyl-6-methoxy-1,4-benzoquinone monooxygenase [Burkholderiales bacterium]|nr:2-polyprenyl-3-methyl-6-methoxy-1,4-benzoquinone monooxygenase [Burkholderiales bacterium]